MRSSCNHTREQIALIIATRKRTLLFLFLLAATAAVAEPVAASLDDNLVEAEIEDEEEGEHASEDEATFSRTEKRGLESLEVCCVL